MVIDDDTDIRRALRKVLERDGHTVVEEPNGHSALRHFTGDPADLVISDVYMPDMDGIDFLMRVRDAFPDARFIMISGGGSLGKESVLQAAERLGADRVLEKPFKVQEVREMVQDLLPTSP